MVGKLRDDDGQHRINYGQKPCIPLTMQAFWLPGGIGELVGDVGALDQRAPPHVTAVPDRDRPPTGSEASRARFATAHRQASRRRSPPTSSQRCGSLP